MMFTIKQEAVGDKQAPKWKQKENIKVTKSFQSYMEKGTCNTFTTLNFNP